MKINAEVPAKKTIDRYVGAYGVTPSCLLAWSQQLTKSTASATTNADDLMEGNMKAKAVFEHHTALRIIFMPQSWSFTYYITLGSNRTLFQYTIIASAMVVCMK
ncbi:unnamed protein product [Phytophthora fragariaefolia]|uniref:Unnamed protein product n=1 Tax=Phytophthora fragariaefolia TaxID=1490495 RepID=A0A9W6U298_9STRA|nr:unnamed protein product [Phytophthora fragariaefolia]